MYTRFASKALLEALKDTTVIVVTGPRQSGKSTLVRQVEVVGKKPSYISLDDISIRGAVLQDPIGFTTNLEKPAIIDEAQRVPELFSAIKIAVDNNRVPGNFILTGSADPYLVPNISESLAGRMERIRLWPLSQGELRGRQERFIDKIFNDKISAGAMEEISLDELRRIVLTGGFPEAVTRTDSKRRSQWFHEYSDAIILRDVRALAAIEDVTDFPLLLRLLATKAMAPINYSDVSRNTGIPNTTLRRYVSLLATTYVIGMLPPWSKVQGHRAVKAHKLFFGDTGLLAHLLGANEENSTNSPFIWGQLLENFVLMELNKQIGWSNIDVSMLYYRTHTGREVDIVLEARDGRVAGIEVKAASSVRAEDFNGLQSLSETSGDKFVRGVVLYTGTNTIPFGENMWAVPIRALWEW